MRSNSGFTLMELMVVIAIIAIVAAMALPNLIGAKPKQQLKSAAEDIVSMVMVAKSTAIKERAYVVVTFNPGADSYSVFVDNGDGDDAGDWVQDSGERTLRSRNITAGIDLTDTSFTAERFRFDSRGLANESGTISLSGSHGDAKVIQITLTGIPRIL